MLSTYIISARIHALLCMVLRLPASGKRPEAHKLNQRMSSSNNHIALPTDHTSGQAAWPWEGAVDGEGNSKRHHRWRGLGSNTNKRCQNRDTGSVFARFRMMYSNVKLCFFVILNLAVPSSLEIQHRHTQRSFDSTIKLYTHTTTVDTHKQHVSKHRVMLRIVCNAWRASAGSMFGF